MTKLKFDKRGFLLPQKIEYKVRHDEQTEEFIDKYIENDCNFQIEFDKKGDCKFEKRKKDND